MTSWPYEVFDDLCLRVGLKRSSSLPESSATITPPAGAVLWTSPYAYLVLWPVFAEDLPSLALASANAQDWLDTLLLKAEGESTACLDGYLILALASPPAAEAHPLVRELELSTQVCRKHVIWPDSSADEGWRGLLSVTVLGLPRGTSGTASPDWPSFDHKSEELWNRIQELGHQAVAASDIAEASQ